MADKYANWNALISDTNPDGSLVNVQGVAWQIYERPGIGDRYVMHLAIHGGAIEPPPQQLADAAAGLGGFYSFAGLKSSGNSDLHITSTHFDEPRALALQQRAAYTVSWHGHADKTAGRAVTYVGGLDTALGSHIRGRLTAAGFTVEDPPSDLAGVEPTNITNRNLRGAGVQLEMSRSQRAAFYVGGNLSRSWIENPANRTPAFARYVTAVQDGVDDFLQSLPTDDDRTLAAPGAVGGLGCAQGYSATLHWRGGARVYGAQRLSALTAVKWNRSLNDISEATITVAKPSISPECCDALGQAEPWIHELTLYRDDELIWQGPVRRTIETRSSFVVEAVDVFAWLDKVVNTYVMRFRTDGPDLDRRPGPVTKIAETIMRLNLVNSPLSIPADWAGIMSYVVRQDTTTTITFEKDGTNNVSVWAAYVGDILRELTKRGLTFTTVGRSIVLRGRATVATRALTRLSLDHIIGDVQIIRDGTTTATASWATNQSDVDTAAGRTEIAGQFGTAYGRIDSLVHVEEDGDASAAETITALRQAAAADLGGRYPTPIAISIPDGSQLSPNAPVTINQLVCGERLDVVSVGFCTQVAQGFVITDVSGEWTDSGEKVALSLAPLSS